MKIICKILLSLLLVIPILSLGQNVGIEFRAIDDLESAMAKATEEGKDIYATLHYVGCVHCVRMEKNVFVTEEVGDYYNENFVSLSLDINEDNLGTYFKDTYTPGGYPAHLYFDENGMLQHKALGYRTPNEFIQIAEIASDENQNLAYYKTQVEKGNADAQTLRTYFSFDYVKNKDDLIQDYLDACDADQLFSKDTWLLLKENAPMYNSTYFQYILDHENKFRASVGDKAVDDYLIGRWVFMVNQWSAWWANDGQRDKMEKELRKTNHPLCDRVAHQVNMEVWMERASWRKDSKSKLKKFIKNAKEYYAHGYDDWYNYYKSAWIIIANTDKLEQDDIDFGYQMAQSSVELNKDFENLYVYAYYCVHKDKIQEAVEVLKESLTYEKPNTNPTYIEDVYEKIEEWGKEI